MAMFLRAAAGLLVMCCAGGVAATASSVNAALAPAFARVADGGAIPDRVVTALVEDRSGFIWIGTTGGLLRYDGYRFRHFAHDRNDLRSLSGNLIRALHVARDGRLWVGTDADGLSVFDPSTETFDRFTHDPSNRDSIANGSIFAVTEDHAGGFWIGTSGGGLDFLQTETGRFRHHRAGASGLKDDRVNALLIDRDGDLWVGTSGGLYQKPAGSTRFKSTATTVAGAEALAAATVYSLYLDVEGKVWVGTREGHVFRIDPLKRIARHMAAPDSTESTGTASVLALGQANPDEIWLGLTTGIEIRDLISGDLIWRLRHDPAVASSLGGNDIRALLVDRAGVIWAGGFGSGVQRHYIDARAVAVRRGSRGFAGVLAEPNITAVLELSDGRLWLGTRGNGVAVLDANLHLVGGFKPQPEVEGALDVGWITALAQTTDGMVWLGSRDGVRRYDPGTGRFASFRAEQGLNSESDRRLLADPNDVLWIGSRDGVYRLRPGEKRPQRVPEAEGIDGTGDVNALVMDAQHNLWVGAVRGLFRLNRGAQALVAVEAQAGHELIHASVLGLLLDRQGALWIDTPLGLHVLRELGTLPARFESISARLDVAGSDFGANLLEDASGRIWTHRFVFDPAVDGVYVLTESDGVAFGTGWYRAYAKKRDGRLLFGGSEGLLVIDPAHFRPWIYSPPVVVTELRVDGRPQAFGGPQGRLQLSPDQRSFSLEFAALDFSAPDRNRYSYRLEGFDRDWIGAGASYRVAGYSNLWPGDYRLRVRGSNRTGAVSPHELTFAIRVLPAWWQTAWFAVSIALSLWGLGYGAVRWRTWRIQQRARALEVTIAERTAELREAKGRAESALEQLVGAQQQLVQAEKMASLGQLVAGIAHEVNTPIGIAVTAASHLQEVTREGDLKLASGKLSRSDLEYWRATSNEGMRLILGSLERASKLISSFKQVAVDQSSEKRRSIDLLVFLEEVLAALHPTYRRSGHRIELDCPPGIHLDTFPGALFQIFTNLVTNALTHAFANDSAGIMQLSARTQSDTVELRFRDDGSGMSAEVSARAFDPFFTTRRGTGGSGLGLHLVYNLVTQLLGGTIELHSRPGQGSEFVIRIPRRAPEHSGQVGRSVTVRDPPDAVS